MSEVWDTSVRGREMTAERARGVGTGSLVLLRHGQSAGNLEDRFTGWDDIDLTGEGRDEAHRAGRLLKEVGLSFDAAFAAGLRTVVTGVLVEELVEDLQEIAEETLEGAVAEGLPPTENGPRALPDAVPVEGVAPSDAAPPDAPASPAGASERTQEAAPIADRRREVMDLMAGAGTPTEVAVARAAADSYLASDPSDGDVRMARDRLPNPTGD